jgi:hypothetical protein
LIIGPILDFDVKINSSRREDFTRTGTTNSVDIGQTNFSTLVFREVYASNSRHFFRLMGLTLSLLQLRILLVDDIQAALATDNLAISATLFK